MCRCGIPHRLQTKTILTPKILIITPFVTYIYITYIILTEIIVIFNCYGVTMTQLTTFVSLYSRNNIALKMTAEAAETCW